MSRNKCELHGENIGVAVIEPKDESVSPRLIEARHLPDLFLRPELLNNVILNLFPLRYRSERTR